jgi:hypothetical protein
MSDEKLKYITCPLCGETDFDRAGFMGHLDQWCEEAAKGRDEWAEVMRKERDAHVLRMQARALAEAEEREEQEREEMRLDLRDEEDGA